MAHRLWIGSMILLLMLHARQKRVVFEKISIVLRRACCAPGVILSASSRIMILCRPGGRVTFFCAKALILLRTTSIPLRSAISDTHGTPRRGPRTAHLMRWVPARLPCRHPQAIGGPSSECSSSYQYLACPSGERQTAQSVRKRDYSLR